jgi:HNH endonuclease
MSVSAAPHLATIADALSVADTSREGVSASGGISSVNAQCSEPECPRPAAARGMCKRHYNAWRDRQPGELGERDFAKRFWSKVRKGDGCWEWLPSLGRRQYGNVAVGPKVRRVHRVAWELTFGPIPAGLFVCHHCDNPPCVRPDHLFLGSHADNMADAFAKGRIPCKTRRESSPNPGLV